MKKWLYRTLRICGVIFLIQISIAIAVSTLAIANPDGFTQVLAQYLIREDNIEKSDAVVVIGGFENEKRIDYGIGLYKQGYGNKMIVSGAGDTDYLINYITSHDLKKENILIDQDAATTDENALNVKKMADDNKIKSFILITSPDQSKRARQVFDKVFRNSGIKIFSTSYTDSEFIPEQIMNSKTAKQQLVTEWTKMIYYMLK